ncbi:MAG: sigma-70 family RNA polymerase sigma factor [Anaerolineae bacterium]|nr:sigma-70 family RNA polymerase sigma factor [Anaerolineae bacterium]
MIAQFQEALDTIQEDADQDAPLSMQKASDGKDEDWADIEDLLTYIEPEDVFPADTHTDSDALIPDDSLSLYLNQMGELPLLSQEEEVALSKKIKRGRQAQEQLEAQAESDFTAEQFAELNRQVEEGQQARQHFIEANTRLVVSEAKHYRGSGLSFLDLIQSGNIGLIKAVDRFDYRLGNRFSTYATWWIRQTIRRTLTNQGYTIRLPAHMRQRMHRFQRTARKLEKTLGYPPTPEGIAAALGIEDVRNVRRLLRIGQRTLSLDAPVDGGDGTSDLTSFIEDEATPTPSQQVQKHLLQEDIETLMDRVLSPRELEVLRRRFGFNDGEPQTLSAVADDLEVSRERVRQIEQRALRKLRHPTVSYKLREYLS